MNDKHVSSEDMGQEDISGGDEASSNFRNERELYTCEKPFHNFREVPSYSISSQSASNLEKTIPQDNLLNLLKIKNRRKTEGENPGMSPAFSSLNKKHSSISYVIILLVLLTAILASIAVISYSLGFGGDIGSSEKVAVIYIQGTILSGNVPAGLGYATSEGISENIRSATADKNVKAIVLRINSPGGSPAAAQEIVREIKKAQAQGLPVVVSMGDLAASAGYYISAPTDYIIANPSTNTGSIGVIWVFQNMSDYNKEEGTEYYVSKSGEFKDMGSTWRGLTDDEKEYADAVVMESYEDFVTTVAEGRNMTKSEVKTLADGRIYTGAKAKELGLVDDFGNMYDAIDKAAELGGIVGEPRVEYMNRASLSDLLLGSDSGESNETASQFVSYFEESPYGKLLT